MRNVLLKYVIPILTLISLAVLWCFGEIEVNPATIIGLVTIGLTYFYVVFTWEMVAKMKEDSDLERRPYVVPEIYDHEHVSINIRIKNQGKTPAFDLKVRTEPEMKISGKGTLNDAIFHTPITLLAPGSEIDTLMGASSRIFENFEYPKKYTIKLNYTDARGKPYSEDYNCDFEYMRKLMWLKRNGLHQINANIETQNRILKRIQDKMGQNDDLEFGMLDNDDKQ